jgi:hypothetical protein
MATGRWSGGQRWAAQRFRIQGRSQGRTSRRALSFEQPAVGYLPSAISAAVRFAPLDSGLNSIFLPRSNGLRHQVIVHDKTAANIEHSFLVNCEARLLIRSHGGVILLIHLHPHRCPAELPGSFHHMA